MKVNVFKDAQTLGREAANFAVQTLNDAIAKNGEARIVMSTGASQFELLKALIQSDVDWTKVVMFHLDEYIGLPMSHPASFRKYLQERFIDHVNLRNYYFVDGEGDVEAHIAALTQEIRKSPIDLGLIGIGENAHIAFNDPPADFETKEAYIVVTLDDQCKQQQVGEGWFKTPDEVPKQAITMTVHQIMQCETIISCVPGQVKAKAIQQTFEQEVNPQVPATMLKQHQDVNLFLDEESATLADVEGETTI